MSAIYTPGSKRDADASPSPFWSSALHQFWKLNPKYELTGGNLKDAALARSTPLFNNTEIAWNNKPLIGKTWERYADAGIRRLCDLIFFDRIGTHAEVCEYYQAHLPLRTFNLLIQALPQRLVNIATYCPRPPIGSSWALKAGPIHTVYKICSHDGPPDELWANTWTTEEPFSAHFPTFLGRILITDLALLRPAEIEWTDRVRVKYLDNRELVPQELKTEPRISQDHQRPKHEDTWTKILRPPPLLPPDWTSTYKRLWKLKVPNRWKDLWWLILRRSLLNKTNKTNKTNIIFHHHHHHQQLWKDRLTLHCDKDSSSVADGESHVLQIGQGESLQDQPANSVLVEHLGPNAKL